jgi:hypothetical protein
MTNDGLPFPHVKRRSRINVVAISLGLSANFPNDHEMLEHGMVMYDALYTWCRSLQAETHNWPATPVTQARHG